MREIRFTTQDLNYTDPNEDCVISSEDPLYTSITGQPASCSLPHVDSSNKGRQQQEQNIKPGTPEWFRLWFGR